MFKNYYLFRWLYLLLVLVTVNLQAHTLDNINAQLNILPDHQYQLIIEVDTFHLAKDTLNYQGSDAALINKLSALSLIELKRLLDKIRQSIQQNSYIYFDDNKMALNVFSGLSVAEFKSMLTAYNTYTFSLSSTGTIPPATKHLAVRFAPELGNVVLTVAKPSKDLVTMNSLSAKIAINDIANNAIKINRLETFMQYLYQGYVHIVPKGLDHILFVLALFLLARKTSTLLWQISVFTLAHTITLALGIYNVINLPSNIVEPLIALSIAYVAVENIYQQQISRWRLPLIFAFGLLHGLGFASVLLALGLQKEQFVTSLVAFNIGVEIGQLSVVLVAFALLGWFYKKDWYHKRIVLPLSLLIAIVGLYWFIERII
ncbi:HupE/UreJ family protein [Thalassotalea piscium]|uniref:HupE/UreJ family protein n=1 Tax=Thalassotalea piscium TaxID=1230533 RepID=A0A7X0TTD1_9GAMM|nr:HupE/UreJ family protein [Thalassotalea piscium]MBB6542970.1 hypothetical protein [Thalassotalea piscium]